MPTLEACSLNSNKLKGPGKYYKIGKGFPIVLLHGFAETFEIWQPLINDLSKKYRLIIPQIPGCGTMEAFVEEFSMEAIADYVFDILEYEGIEKTILFGHSMGGYAAMSFAEKYNDKLIGVSLVHSSARADTADKIKIRISAIEFIQKNGKKQFLKTLIPKLYASNNQKHSSQKWHLEMANQYSDTQLIACYAAMMNRTDKVSLLSLLPFPIQFIGGREDLSIDYKDLTAQATLCKKPILTIFEEIGHTSMFENPLLLKEAIIGFTDDILQTI